MLAFATSPQLIAMTAPQPQPPRPVFVHGAVSRIARQQTWKKRVRSVKVLASFFADDILWWLRKGLWCIPATLRSARERITVTVSDKPASPSVDIYAHEDHKSYVQTRVANEQSHIETPHTPVVVYVHGGAWGSGDSTHYSQMATTLTARTKAVVLVASYALYPDSDMDKQTDDVAVVLRYARRTFPNQQVVLLAHSSGAQISALALLRAAKKFESLSVDVAVLSAGPYHLMHHFLFEAGRGVADVSPMLPAARAELDGDQFDVRSPTCLAEKFDGFLQEVKGLPTSRLALEGEVAASNVYLPDVQSSPDEIILRGFPRTYIMSSSRDSIVPIYSSVRFAAALRKLGLDARLLVYDHMDHVDFVTDWFSNAQPRELADVLDVDDNDQKRRSQYVSNLKGQCAVALMSDSEQHTAPSPYSRDVLRIINHMTNLCA